MTRFMKSRIQLFLVRHPAPGEEADLAVLDDADIEALLEADGSSAVEPHQLDEALASAPPDESLFEEGEFDLSADDTQDPAGP
jgi:hypothetical protein